MPNAPALRLVKDAPVDPMAMLRAELREAELKAIATKEAADAQRHLARQWKTVAEILALRLGGDVTITEAEIAAFFKERRPVNLVGNPEAGTVRLVVGAPRPTAPQVESPPAAPPPEG